MTQAEREHRENADGQHDELENRDECPACNRAPSTVIQPGSAVETVRTVPMQGGVELPRGVVAVLFYSEDEPSNGRELRSLISARPGTTLLVPTSALRVVTFGVDHTEPR